MYLWKPITTRRFNWATSQQKWIATALGPNGAIGLEVSIGPLLSRNGQFFAKRVIKAIKDGFQLGHFLAEMDSPQMTEIPVTHANVSIGPLLSRNGQYRLDTKEEALTIIVSIGPLLSRNGQAETPKIVEKSLNEVSIGPLLSRNGQAFLCAITAAIENKVSIGPLLSRNGQEPCSEWRPQGR